jgi:hypothetical protein
MCFSTPSLPPLEHELLPWFSPEWDETDSGDAKGFGIRSPDLRQDEASSVVWGMPGFVARAGLADEILPLDEIGAEIVRATTLQVAARTQS